jgi:hypothetical protein
MRSDKYLAYKKHFEDFCEKQTLEDHHFAQLDLDLQWASSAADTFMSRDGCEPLIAMVCGLNAIAGRRWSRFKAAEEASNHIRASEMKAFASFWYKLAAEIDCKANKKAK